MPPVAKVVLVVKRVAWTADQLVEAHRAFWRPLVALVDVEVGQQVGPLKTIGSTEEAMQVAGTPAHHRLQQVVQMRHVHVAAHCDPAPDGRPRADQVDAHREDGGVQRDGKQLGVSVPEAVERRRHRRRGTQVLGDLGHHLQRLSWVSPLGHQLPNQSRDTVLAHALAYHDSIQALGDRGVSRPGGFSGVCVLLVRLRPG